MPEGITYGAATPAAAAVFRKLRREIVGFLGMAVFLVRAGEWQKAECSRVCPKTGCGKNRLWPVS
jgi:hypothetical protein